MNSLSLIVQYRAIHMVAKKMLELAQRGAWIEVAATATQIEQLIDAIRSIRSGQVLEESALRERGEILHSLIQIDYEVRRLREPWTQKLDSLLGR